MKIGVVRTSTEAQYSGVEKQRTLLQDCDLILEFHGYSGFTGAHRQPILSKLLKYRHQGHTLVFLSPDRFSREGYHKAQDFNDEIERLGFKVLIKFADEQYNQPFGQYFELVPPKLFEKAAESSKLKSHFQANRKRYPSHIWPTEKLTTLGLPFRINPHKKRVIDKILSLHENNEWLSYSELARRASGRTIKCDRKFVSRVLNCEFVAEYWKARKTALQRRLERDRSKAKSGNSGPTPQPQNSHTSTANSGPTKSPSNGTKGLPANQRLKDLLKPYSHIDQSQISICDGSNIVHSCTRSALTVQQRLQALLNRPNSSIQEHKGLESRDRQKAIDRLSRITNPYLSNEDIDRLYAIAERACSELDNQGNEDHFVYRQALPIQKRVELLMRESEEDQSGQETGLEDLDCSVSDSSDYSAVDTLLSLKESDSKGISFEFDTSLLANARNKLKQAQIGSDVVLDDSSLLVDAVKYGDMVDLSGLKGRIDFERYLKRIGIEAN